MILNPASSFFSCLLESSLRSFLEDSIYLFPSSLLSWFSCFLSNSMFGFSPCALSISSISSELSTLHPFGFLAADMLELWLLRYGIPLGWIFELFVFFSLSSLFNELALLKLDSLSSIERLLFPSSTLSFCYLGTSTTAWLCSKSFEMLTTFLLDSSLNCTDTFLLLLANTEFSLYSFCELIGEGAMLFIYAMIINFKNEFV